MEEFVSVTVLSFRSNEEKSVFFHISPNMVQSVNG